MRKHKVLCISRIRGKSKTKVDEPNVELEEELTEELLEECVPQPSSDEDDEKSEDLEEDPEEEPIEELEEEQEKDPIEELEEEPEEEPSEELVEETDEEEPEEEPSEELDEDPEEEPSGETNDELEEDPEEEPSKETTEELEEEPAECISQSVSSHNDTEQMIDDPYPSEPNLLENSASKPYHETDADEEEPSGEANDELEEDPEEEPSEETNEELEEEPAECISLSVSNHNDTEQMIDNPYPSEPNLLENSASKPHHETDADEDGYKSESFLNNSNEKKRSLDATAGESAPLQINPSRKKSRQEESSKPESDFEFAVKSGVSKAADGETASRQQECMGSSEKRRRSRWDSQPTVDSEMDEVDRNSKRRKTRWAGDDSLLKMLGPIQLPDFMKELVVGSEDPKIKELKLKLSGINSKLKSSDLPDDRPEGERSPSPPPVYNNLGIRINTREVRLREKLIQERQNIISRLIQKNPTFKRPTDYKPPKLLKKLYIPVKEYPDYNFIGLILGPRGNTQKRMEKETGAKICLRGKGSKLLKKTDTSDNEDLHVLIEASNQKSLDAAVGMVEKLLIPVQAGMSEHKLAQLQELAKLNGSYRDEDKCIVCSEKGHKQYACPQLQSNFKIAHSCDSCGGNSHRTASCPSNSLQGSSRVSVGSTPKTQNKHKETSDANLYVGYLPQAVDDNQLRELFKTFGKLTEVKVIKDRTIGLSKGYGFVKFANSTDAAVAVTHMNGHRMDGKVLAVRLAGGRPPPSSSSTFSHLPMYPGPAAVSPVVPSQGSWPGPPGSMLPEPQASFPKSEGVGFLPSSIKTRHGGLLIKSDASGFSPLSGVLSLPDSMSASSLSSSYKYSNHTHFFSPISPAQFPGDPDYPGSQFQSYFATPTINPTPPNHFSQPPESDSKPFSWSTGHLP